jgi:transcription elongation GreA/GreB family factor
MATQPTHLRELIEKIERLPRERQAEIEDFVEFLSRKDQEGQLTQAAMRSSHTSFDRVWDNPDDSAYDTL